MTNNQLTSTHLAVKSELDGYKIHASRGQATALAMVALFESIDNELTELQERRKADSEPVAVPDHLTYLQNPTLENVLSDAEENSPMAHAARILAREVKFWRSVPLYRHAQQPVVDADDNFYSWFGREWHENYQHNQYTTAAKQMLGVMAESAWKAGHRAAMLQAGNSPAQSDCCPAQNSVTPAQGGNSLVIPDEMTSGQAYEIGYYYGDPVNVFARGANWMRQHIIDSTLAAAPHDTPALNSVQSVVTVPGKWIPVSERMPEVGVKVLCFPVEDEPIHATFNGQLWLQDVSWSGSDEPIDNVIPTSVTHWMPLPATPQEVK